MDYSPVGNEVANAFWWLVPIALVIGLLKSPWFKGVLGETLVKLAAKL